ncbi:MAG: glycoside hydrolase family 9 protein [bacterium]|nr:glycoside hydrolase family 9 protein [bacterium]
MIFPRTARRLVPAALVSVTLWLVGAVALAAQSRDPELRVSVNQVGYFPDAVKMAMFAVDSERQSTWTLTRESDGALIASGQTSPARFDPASGDFVQRIDFSTVREPGTYRLNVEDVRSAAFRIGNDIYGTLAVDALRYFYLSRSGIALERTYAGVWARDAGHLSDADIGCYSGTDADGVTWDGCAYRLDADGGWYDAGDYGKYVVNGAFATWVLLNAFERNPMYYAGLPLNIPETGAAVAPDILSEARWELEFLLAMQVPEGAALAGMAHHKLHDLRWSPFPFRPPTYWNNDDPQNGRYVYPPTTAATLNLAAVAAQCARIWRDLDPPFAARCLAAAERAWTAALENPNAALGNTPGEGGGAYGDSFTRDEQFWAAAELFITTGGEPYGTFLATSEFFYNVEARANIGTFTALNWSNTAALGTLSLALLPNALAPEQTAALRGLIVEVANVYLATINREGYRVPLSGEQYVWGSNGDVMNAAIMLGYAYDHTQDARYLHAMIDCLDYVLGRNTFAFSFTAGYGEQALQRPHHRFWYNDQGYPPPPPGALAGGANASPVDPVAIERLLDLPPARRYLDHPESFSTNEVAINWNAALAWVTGYLDSHFRVG